MPRLPESGLFGKVHAQINALWDEVRCNRIAQGKDYRIQRTSGGTKLEILGGSSTTAPGDVLRWRGEWTAATPPDGLGAYRKSDLVIRGSANASSSTVNDTDDILDDGTKAGLYIARQDIDPTTDEPTEPASDPANWETFARGAWHTLTIREFGASNKLQLDGRDATGTAIAALSALNGHDIEFREYDVCVNGVTKKAILWGSLPY
jgi:hypothetical protein